MALDLPENVTQVGILEAAQVLKDDGELGLTYGFDGMSLHAAIGVATAVLRRLEHEAEYAWDTCPDCGRPWKEHEGSEE